ncbi:MAG: hypothetical protein H0U95_03730 [Bacteroidetes bacterium]|nr:hypothetical protein [Bacteroidota bacterium]
MELHLKIIGYMCIALAFVHIIFPKKFYWKKEMPLISLVNRQLMYVHTFFIAFVVLLMGLLCICCTIDLLTTRLGNAVIFGLFLFWFTRLLFQFFVYSPRLWRGKAFETLIHIIFSLIWLYFTSVFSIIYFGTEI